MRFSVISNAAYLIPGIVAWQQHGFGPFALSCFLLAAGSAAFHACHDRGGKLAYWSHHADESAMYFVFSALALMAADLDSWFIILPVWIASHLAALRYGSGQILPVLASITVGCMLSQGMYWQILSAIAVFGAAYWVRTDEPSTLRHGWWHVLTSGLIGMLWWFLQ